MADINKQTPEFMDFMFNGLDHGVNSISDGGGPLVPFLMTKIGDKKELKRFVTERYEEGIAVAEQTVKDMTPKPDFALIAFDGFITWEEKKYDAIFLKHLTGHKTKDLNFVKDMSPKQTEME
ncbi:hypothetical protein [Sphingobacterium sp. T2]|uniref:hypothetical protein n=1 Tax=Sphingobacterium sp. T2 TaxID=1590596 RepID=UPI00057BA774|nr:hypothetical protein [Sphingobacterium sp. T2]